MRTDRRFKPGHAVAFFTVAMMVGVAASSAGSLDRSGPRGAKLRSKMRVNDRQAMQAWLACFSEAAKELSGKRLSTKLVAVACNTRQNIRTVAMQTCVRPPAGPVALPYQFEVVAALLNLPPPGSTL